MTVEVMCAKHDIGLITNSLSV